MDDLELERMLVMGNKQDQDRVTHDRAAMPRRVGSTLFRIGIHIAHVISSLVGDDVFSRKVRAAVLRMAGANLGKESSIHGGTYLSKPSNLTLGFHAMVNRNCYFDLEAPVTIGDYAGAGHGATFVTTVHGIVPGMNVGIGMTAKPITIGDRAWIGANATVLPGVTVGEDAIVAAGALVVGDVPANCLVAGVPGKVLRREVRSWLRDLAAERDAVADLADQPQQG